MSAVGAVTLRRLLHNSLTCLRCTPIASAKAPCVRPIGSMNSSTRISPTLAGLRFVVSMGHLIYSCGRPGRSVEFLPDSGHDTLTNQDAPHSGHSLPHHFG